MVDKFDENNDGEMQLCEYEEIVKHLEPSIDKKICLKLFKQAITMADDGINLESMDAISPEVLMR